MSVAALPSQVGVSLGRVVRSEWTKLWSLRSTRWSLLVSVVAMDTRGNVGIASKRITIQN